MSTQYGRRVSLIMSGADGEGIDLSHMKIRFNTKQVDLQTPNTLSARVYNLTRKTADLIGVGLSIPGTTVQDVNYQRVVLQAGYEGDQGNFGIIFDGQVKQTRFGRENAHTTYFDILAADGDGAYNYAVCNSTLEAGANTVENQVSAAYRSMREYGVGVGDVTETNPNPRPRGRVLSGPAKQILRNVCNSEELTWTIVDNKLQLLRLNSYAPGAAVELTSRTGMIGLPEQTQDGIHIKCLLNPRLRVSRRVKVDNTSIQRAEISTAYAYRAWFYLPSIAADGIYRIMIVEHHGDTRGNEWQSDLICLDTGTHIPPSLRDRNVIGGLP